MKPLHSFIRRCSGQALLEFAITAPLALLIVLGVTEVGATLIDEHVVTRLAREGSNLISRDTTLQSAANALGGMSHSPVDFSNGSRLIFSVIKRGATTGTPNYDRLVLYQRHSYGTLAATSHITTAGGASFGGPPDYIAPNSDSNTSLRITGAPGVLVTPPGGMVYVTEIFTTRPRITPLHNFGISVPTTLYSIAYF